MKILSGETKRAGIFQPTAGSPRPREVSELWAQSTVRPVEIPAAVLWDMDGTLVDSEPFWIAGQHALAADHGREWTASDTQALIGSGLPEAGIYIKERLNSVLSGAEIIDYLATRVIAELHRHVPWRPGALELAKALHKSGIRQGLVTMSYANIAQPVVDALDFDVVVTGDVVAYSKPHPEPYLLAARQLGVAAADCIAVEDSRTGTASASAAGCFVVAVPHLVDIAAAPRRAVISSLADYGTSSFIELTRDHSHGAA